MPVTLEQIEQLFKKIFEEKFGPVSEIATSIRELLTSAGETRTIADETQTILGETRTIADETQTILGESSTSAGRLTTDVSSLSYRMERLTEDLKRIKPGRANPVLSGPPTRHYHTVTELHSVSKPVKRRRGYLG